AADRLAPIVATAAREAIAVVATLTGVDDVVAAQRRAGVQRDRHRDVVAGVQLDGAVAARGHGAAAVERAQRDVERAGPVARDCERERRRERYRRRGRRRRKVAGDALAAVRDVRA